MAIVSPLNPKESFLFLFQGSIALQMYAAHSADNMNTEICNEVEHFNSSMTMCNEYEYRKDLQMCFTTTASV